MTKKVVFKDGREVLVDADFMMCPGGSVHLVKREGDHNTTVRSYPASEVKNVVDVVVPSVKVLAMKLLTVTSAVPHGSRKLAELAGIDYSDIVVPILKKLRDAGKVVFVEGKWKRKENLMCIRK